MSRRITLTNPTILFTRFAVLFIIFTTKSTRDFSQHFWRFNEEKNNKDREKEQANK